MAKKLAAKKSAPKNPKKVKLPEKPSALILLALNDLAAVEKMKNYEIDMETWHDPSVVFLPTGGPTTTCTVCFAGSVMVRSLKANPSEIKVPECFNKTTQRKLNALNSLRVGCIRDAIEDLDLDPNSYFAPENVDIHPYDQNKKYFKQDMRQLAENLKRNGL